MRHRFYDAAQRRFISPDPLGIDDLLEREEILNLFAYARDNPLWFSDPLGLWQFAIGGAYGIGGYVTFGRNEERWNVRLAGGLGYGAFFAYDPEDRAVGFLSEGLAIELGVEGQAHGEVLGLAEATVGLRSSIGADKGNNYRWNTQGRLSAQIRGTALNIGGSVDFGLQGNADHRAVEPYFDASRPRLSFGLGGMLFGGGFANISWDAQSRSDHPVTPAFSVGGPPK